ncbi:hypothetical protein MUP77_22860 [Candidatus Bathyarchaeota archaeon]|nr:hypothetical protein [Candidatus Bathyarchaeota archaeon]
MVTNWKGFLVAIRKEPKNFAKAIVDNLNPPKYATKEMAEFEWMCHFCWKPRIDICNWCQKSVCEEHGQQFIGEKTKLEWYICPDDLKTHNRAEILKKISEEDERFYLEDQAETQKP